MSVVQHFDQAVFELETLVQQCAQFLEFFCNTFPGIAEVGERQQLLGDDIDTRVDRLGLFQATLIVKGLCLFGQLVVDAEMTGGHVVNQYTAEIL